MRLRSLLTLPVALAATFVASGCAVDSPSAPKATISAPTVPSHSTSGSTLWRVTPLQRGTPLANNITVSKSIGLLGGTIAIPAAGVSVVVPPLAVTKTTTISITARAGSAFAYDFAPHGTTFVVPLVMTQSLAGSQGGSALLSALQLGYYPDGTDPTTCSELLNVSVDLLKLTGVSTISHFSGYIFASAREEE